MNNIRVETHSEALIVKVRVFSPMQEINSI